MVAGKPAAARPLGRSERGHSDHGAPAIDRPGDRSLSGLRARHIQGWWAWRWAPVRPGPLRALRSPRGASLDVSGHVALVVKERARLTAERTLDRRVERQVDRRTRAVGRARVRRLHRGAVRDPPSLAVREPREALIATAGDRPRARRGRGRPLTRGQGPDIHDTARARDQQDRKRGGEPSAGGACGHARAVSINSPAEATESSREWVLSGGWAAVLEGPPSRRRDPNSLVRARVCSRSASCGRARWWRGTGRWGPGWRSRRGGRWGCASRRSARTSWRGRSARRGRAGAS